MPNILSDLHISRLTLGTVQFGIPYGVANKSGMPSFDEVKQILALAVDNGITCLDTASAYGTSEETIGAALCDLGISDRVTVVTKAARVPADTPISEGYAKFEASVLQSIDRLKINPLPLVLIHDETNMPLLECLDKLKQKGLIQHIGASVQFTSWAKSALNNDLVEAIQWPGNLMDMRYERQGLYDMAIGKCDIFLRSIYLQGLLVMTDEDTPDHLQEIIPIRDRLMSIAAASGMNIQEMALRYGLSLKGCTTVLVGVESVEQLRSNIAVMNKGALPADVLAAIREAVPEIDETILLPVHWAARAAAKAASS